MAKAIGGDFMGSVIISIGALWTGPKASKFKSLSLNKPNAKYTLDDIESVQEMSYEVAKSFAASAVGAGAGMLVLGGFGLVAGAIVSGNNKRKVVTSIKFKDGRHVVFAIKPDDKPYQCLKLAAVENKIYKSVI